MQTAMADDYLESIQYVKEATGLQKSAIYQKISDGSFPRPAKIGVVSRWSRREVQAWVQARLQERAAA